MISFDPHNHPEGREGKPHDSHWPQWKRAQEEGRPARVTWLQTVLGPGLESWSSAWTSHGPLPGLPHSPGQAGAKGQARHSEKPGSHFPSSLQSPRDAAPQGVTLLAGSWASLRSASGSLALHLLCFRPVRQSHLNLAPQRTVTWSLFPRARPGPGGFNNPVGVAPPRWLPAGCPGQDRSAPEEVRGRDGGAHAALASGCPALPNPQGAPAFFLGPRVSVYL